MKEYALGLALLLSLLLVGCGPKKDEPTDRQPPPIGKIDNPSPQPNPAPPGPTVDDTLIPAKPPIKPPAPPVALRPLSQSEAIIGTRVYVNSKNVTGEIATKVINSDVTISVLDPIRRTSYAVTTKLSDLVREDNSPRQVALCGDEKIVGQGLMVATKDGRIVRVLNLFANDMARIEVYETSESYFRIFERTDLMQVSEITVIPLSQVSGVEIPCAGSICKNDDLLLRVEAGRERSTADLERDAKSSELPTHKVTRVFCDGTLTVLQLDKASRLHGVYVERKAAKDTFVARKEFLKK